MKQPTDLRGAVLGRGYRLGRRLGEGDGTPVFEAAHERLPGRLVVRLFPAEALARLDGVARLQRGACFGSLLRTPQALQILDFNLPGDSPAFVVTEWVEGRTLKAMMANDGMLSPISTAEIVESIALALIAGHEQGLVHGDLHPAHVIIPDGARRAKVGGFGWAKELRAVASRPVPSGFLAPEQQFGKVLTVDARADQFALAALAYEMLAGCLPFPEDSSEATAATVTTRLPSPLGELVPGLPPALDDVIRRALSPAPADRFDDVLVFAARFKDAASGARAAIPAPIPVTAADRRSARMVASRPTTSRVPAALPTTPASDITEEMDVRTLWPLVAKADSGGSSGNVSMRIQAEESLDLDLLTHVAREKGYDVEIEGDADSGEVDRRGGGASGGRRSGRRAPVVTAAIRSDDAETLIRRSPFSLPSVSPPPTRRASPSVPSTVVSLAALTPPSSAPSASWAEDSDALDSLSLGPRAPHPIATGTSGATFSTGTFPAPRARIPTLPHHPLMQPVSARHSGFTNVGGWADVPTLDVQSVSLRGSRRWTSAVLGVALLAALVGGGVLVKSRMPGGFGLKASSAAAPVAVNAPAPPLPVRPSVPAPAAAPAPPAPIVAPVQPLPVEPPPSRSNGSGRCSMKIASTPPAEVWIDGEDTGHRTPFNRFKVSCGPHRLVLRRPDTGTERVEFLKTRPGRPFKGDYTID